MSSTSASVGAISNSPSRPLITVGIPAYDRPELLQAALASVEAQENAPALEVVVSDDLGLAATRALVERSTLPNIRYVRNLHPKGAVGNWNQTLAEARGQWITILHEDDLLYPWFIDTVRPSLRPGLAAVAVRCARGATPPSLLRPKTKAHVRRYLRPHFLKSAFTPFPGVLFPTELARRAGGFDASFGPLADYEFWYRLSGYGDIELLSTVAAFYRIAPGQWTGRAWPEMLRRTHLLRLQIAREQFPRHPRLARWLARF
ncbi:MAG TPA: glycosyltransferase, partial [Candidatus Synoicihabitans sp.]|nr:glycosyltransferase [Candidatus Synoicihabitans sp.]